MSNIYILEPPTSGKVLLKTTVGDIDIELWSKEAPKACRNFIQLCLEGYYDNTIFHRVVKDFIVQGGDPNGDGTGGESIYGEPFKDEFHQRLKFARRGLVAMANAGPDDNGSQFFFTLAQTPELQNKHTIFGKVVGDTVFNMLKLPEGLLDDERPVYPHKILKTEILNNPFTDIEPRIKSTEVKEKKKKEKKAGVKNFKLLSFGEEAEEDEEESVKENEKFIGKSKSTHDILDDPKLSSRSEDIEPNEHEEDSEVERVQQLANIREKLKKNQKRKAVSTATSSTTNYDSDDYEEEDKIDHKKKKFNEIQNEIKSIKKEYQQNKLKKEDEKKVEEKEKEEKDATYKEYKDEFDRYKNKSDLLPKKGKGREQFTLELLEKFKNKLRKAKESNEDVLADKKDIPEKTESEDNESWMLHKLQFENDDPVLAKDANTKDDDWFEIYDPRNPLNKRRRGEDTTTTKTKK